MKKTEIQLEVINRVKRFRVERNLSQYDLAILIDTTPGAVGSIESTKFSNKYTLSQLYTLSAKFQIPFVEILWDENTEVRTIDDVLKRIIEYLN